MLTLQQIKGALDDRMLSKVAAATGLHYNTLRELRNNPDANPTYKVMLAISEYLERGCVVGAASDAHLTTGG